MTNQTDSKISELIEHIDSFHWHNRYSCFEPLIDFITQTDTFSLLPAFYNSLEKIFKDHLFNNINLLLIEDTQKYSAQVKQLLLDLEGSTEYRSLELLLVKLQVFNYDITEDGYFKELLNGENNLYTLSRISCICSKFMKYKDFQNQFGHLYDNITKFFYLSDYAHNALLIDNPANNKLINNCLESDILLKNEMESYNNYLKLLKKYKETGQNNCFIAMSRLLPNFKGASKDDDCIIACSLIANELIEICQLDDALVFLDFAYDNMGKLTQGFFIDDKKDSIYDVIAFNYLRVHSIEKSLNSISNIKNIEYILKSFDNLVNFSCKNNYKNNITVLQNFYNTYINIINNKSDLISLIGAKLRLLLDFNTRTHRLINQLSSENKGKYCVFLSEFINNKYTVAKYLADVTNIKIRDFNLICNIIDNIPKNELPDVINTCCMHKYRLCAIAYSAKYFDTKNNYYQAIDAINFKPSCKLIQFIKRTIAKNNIRQFNNSIWGRNLNNKFNEEGAHCRIS